jgi:hypothetical protein
MRGNQKIDLGVNETSKFQVSLEQSLYRGTEILSSS